MCCGSGIDFLSAATTTPSLCSQTFVQHTCKKFCNHRTPPYLLCSISQSGDLFLADARGSIRSVDVRAELLRGALSQAPGADAARTTAPPCASTRITYMASSGSPFMVCATAVSPTGTFLAASGHSVVNNCAHVRVLDLSRCDATRRIGEVPVLSPARPLLPDLLRI